MYISDNVQKKKIVYWVPINKLTKQQYVCRNSC